MTRYAYTDGRKAVGLSDLDNFAAFNAVYGRYLGPNPAPRSTVQVAKLPLGSLVEVECIALV